MLNRLKIIKKIFILLAFISMVISFLVIAETYAKYSTSANGNAGISLARWNIFVNDSSIRNNSDFSNTIEPVFLGNADIASDIIAPRAEGYFDLNLDFSAADVSFIYEINIEPNEESVVKDLVTVGYSIDDGEMIKFDSEDKKITDKIIYEENIEKRKVRIYIKWEDLDQSCEMDNYADTLATQVESGRALLNVKISFTQTQTNNTNNNI